MKARLVLATLLLSAILAAGCNSASDWLKNFSGSLARHDLKRFSALLSGDALAKYGNAEAFESLRAKLTPLRLRAGAPVLIDYQCYATDFLCRDHLVTYQLSILATPLADPKPHYAELNSATVQCIEVDHGMIQINEHCVFTAFAHEF